MRLKFKKHQQFVIDFFEKSNPRGLLLYHGLGSGKTITSIGVAELYSNDVVCIVPASMRTQWDKELIKVGVKNKYDVYSYEEISKLIEEQIVKSNNRYKKRKNSKNININNINDSLFTLLNGKTVIIDEAHRLRNNGGISKRITKATKNINKILLLTGTPMVNGPEDISNLANLIYGKRVMPISIRGFNDKFFQQKNKKKPPKNKRCQLYSEITCLDKGFIMNSKSKYCRYHQYMHDKRLPLKKRKEIKFNSKTLDLKEQRLRIKSARTASKNVIRIPNKKEFQENIQCLTSYYFPDRSDDYPTVTKKKIKVSMSSQQNIEYKGALRLLSKNELKSIENGEKFTGSMGTLNAFMNLTRRISNISKTEKTSPKLEKILEKCIKGPKPIIIYSNWLESGIEPMAKLLKSKHISYYEFTGSKTDKQKKEIVNSYNTGKIDVILLSSSGAEGLDLKNTRQIHIMEPHWNNAKINQVIGRGIRYKSHETLNKVNRKVAVYYWVSEPDLPKDKKGSDEYLYELSQNKIDNMTIFLDTLVKNAIENKDCKNTISLHKKLLNKVI